MDTVHTLEKKKKVQSCVNRNGKQNGIDTGNQNKKMSPTNKLTCPPETKEEKGA